MKRILNPDQKSTLISSHYQKELKAKQFNFRSQTKLETSIISPSLLQSLERSETLNPLRGRNNKKLKHIKSLIPKEKNNFDRHYEMLFNTQKAPIKPLPVIQELETSLLS